MKNLFVCSFILYCFIFLISCDKDDESPEEPTVVDCNDINIVIETVVANASCGEAEGSISATAAGGQGDFQYKLDNGSLQNSGDFTGLKPGTYTLIAQDSENCSASSTVTIESGISFQNSI